MKRSSTVAILLALVFGLTQAASAEVIATDDFEIEGGNPEGWSWSVSGAGSIDDYGQNTTDGWANGPSLPHTANDPYGNAMGWYVASASGCNSNTYYIASKDVDLTRLPGPAERTFSVDWDAARGPTFDSTYARVAPRVTVWYTGLPGDPDLHFYTEDTVMLRDLGENPNWAAITGSQWTAPRTLEIDHITVSFLWQGIHNSSPFLLLDNVRLNVVPEPATMGLLGVGGLLALVRRRRR